MIIFTKEILTEWLNEFYDYSKDDLSSTIDLLLNLSPKANMMLNTLYITGKLPFFEIKGLTADILRKKYTGINDIAILTIYDAFEKRLSKSH